MKALLSIQNWKTLLCALILSGSITVWAAPENIPKGEWETVYDQGVDFYRNGEFEKAVKTFKRLTQEVPESVEGQYYYAISLAQLGRFKDARQSYGTVIKLAPTSETAQLAKEGIDYLPSPDHLDTPPQFQRPKLGQSTPIPKASDVVNAGMGPLANTPTPQPTAAQNPMGMDSQALQMMMMMGSMGGKGSFNPMMIPMIQSMTQNKAGADPQDKIQPEVFSSMMMNQMLDNFSPLDKNNNDD